MLLGNVEISVLYFENYEIVFTSFYVNHSIFFFSEKYTVCKLFSPSSAFLSV